MDAAADEFYKHPRVQELLRELQTLHSKAVSNHVDLDDEDKLADGNEAFASAIRENKPDEHTVFDVLWLNPIYQSEE